MSDFVDSRKVRDAGAPPAWVGLQHLRNRVQIPLPKPARPERTDVYRRGYAVAYYLRQELAQGRRMHHPMPRAAIQQEQVGAARVSAENGVLVGRDLVESRPAGGPVYGRATHDRHPPVGLCDHLLDPLTVYGSIEWSSRHSRRGPEEQNPTLPHPQVKAVGREDGHRHGVGQEVGRCGRGHLSPERGDRQIETGPLRHLGGPRTGRVHHRRRGDRTARGLHHGNAIALPAPEPGDLDLPLQLNPQPLGGSEVPFNDAQGTDETVAGAERSPDYLIESDCGIEPRDLLGPDLDRLGQPLLVLNSPGCPEYLELACRGSEPEVTRRQVSRIPARLFREAAELVAREQRQPNIYGRGILGPEPTSGLAGAALTGTVRAVEHQDLAPAA